MCWTILNIALYPFYAALSVFKSMAWSIARGRLAYAGFAVSLTSMHRYFTVHVSCVATCSMFQ